MDYTITNLIDDLNTLIPEIEDELHQRSMGIHGDGNIKQLQYIRDELIQILENAKRDKLPDKNLRFTSFSRYFVDSWALDSVLGLKLCTLENKYKRMK